MPTHGRNWNAVFAGLIVGALGILLLELPWSFGLVNSSYDYLSLSRIVTSPEEAVIVYLDEASHRALDQAYNKPWDRSLHARLVEQITAGQD